MTKVEIKNIKGEKVLIVEDKEHTKLNLDQKFQVVEESHGNKKVLDVQEQVQIEVRFGEKVDMYLL